MRDFFEAYNKILADIEKLEADIEMAQEDYEGHYSALGHTKLCEMCCALSRAAAVLATVDTDV